MKKKENVIIKSNVFKYCLFNSLSFLICKIKITILHISYNGLMLKYNNKCKEVQLYMGHL